MYDSLAAHGDRYSTLAKGVVEGNTFAGTAAFEFLQHTAEQQGKALNQSDLDGIRKQMAENYLDTLKEIADRNEGIVDREITAKEAEKFHDQTFTKNGLGTEAWTLKTPFGLMGDDGAQRYWETVLDSAGNPAKEFAVASETVA